MRVLSFALLCALVVVSTALDRYTTKYDNVNLDEILRNERLLAKYVQCLLEDTDDNCTADGSELKSHVSEALTNECARCSEKQKQGAEKVVRYLLDHKRDMWTKLEAKYDPTGAYRAKYDARAKKAGYNL